MILFKRKHLPLLLCFSLNNQTAFSMERSSGGGNFDPSLVFDIAALGVVGLAALQQRMGERRPLHLSFGPETFGTFLDIDALSRMNASTQRRIGILNLVRRIYFSQNYWITIAGTPVLISNLANQDISRNVWSSDSSYLRLLRLGFLVSPMTDGVQLQNSNIFLQAYAPQAPLPWVTMRPRNWVPPVQFTGPLGEALSYNDDISHAFLSIARSVSEMRRSMMSLYEFITDPNSSEAETLEIVDVDGDLAAAKSAKNGRVEKFKRAREKLNNRLLWLKINLKQWIESAPRCQTSFESNYPSPLEAYLTLEVIQNIIQLGNNLSQNRYGQESVQVSDQDARILAILCMRHTTPSLMEQIQSLLLPYANQFMTIIGEPNIEFLHYLPELQEATQHPSIERIRSPEEAIVISSSPNKTPKKKRRKKPVIVSSDSTIEEKKPEEQHEPEQEKEATAEQDEAVQKEEETKETPSEKPDNTQERKTNPNKKTEEQRAEERKSRAEKLAEEDRLQREQNQVQYAPSSRRALSPEQAQILIASLTSDHIYTIFQQPSAHHLISYQQVLDLADAVQERMNEIFGDPSDRTFYNLIYKRLYYAHRSKDTGTLLPRHTVDTNRVYFILYGVIPEWWKPQTIGDFRTLEKK